MTIEDPYFKGWLVSSNLSNVTEEFPHEDEETRSLRNVQLTKSVISMLEKLKNEGRGQINDPLRVRVTGGLRLTSGVLDFLGLSSDEVTYLNIVLPTEKVSESRGNKVIFKGNDENKRVLYSLHTHSCTRDFQERDSNGDWTGVDMESISAVTNPLEELANITFVLKT